jgi:hypothetical protein
MTGHVKEWVLKNIGTANFNRFGLWIDFCADIGIAIRNEIGKRGRVGVPISTTFVFYQSYFLGTSILN